MSRAVVVALALAVGACAERTRSIERPDAVADVPDGRASAGDVSVVAPLDRLVPDAVIDARVHSDVSEDVEDVGTPPDGVDARAEMPKEDAATKDAATEDAALDGSRLDAVADVDAALDARDAAPELSAIDRPPTGDVVGDVTVCADDGMCPDGTYCGDDGRCVPWACFPGQVSCVARTRVRSCDRRGTAVTERDCPGGCERDVCAEPTPCVPPRVMCGGVCVNLSSDGSNCGVCGRVCAPWCACVSGTCPCSCPSGSTVCSGVCVAIASDANNCGMCGHTCRPTQGCLRGNCVEGPLLTPTIASLGASDCRSVDHALVNGRDRGGLVVDRSFVLHNGSARVGRWELRMLAPSSPPFDRYDGLVSDLSSGVAYVPQRADGATYRGATDAPAAPFAVSQLAVVLGPLGTFETGFRLRRAVTLYEGAGFFSSWRAVVLFSGSPPEGAPAAWHVIDLMTRDVTTIPAGTAPVPHRTCPSGGWWGVAERTAAGVSVVYVRDRRTVVRTALSDHATTVVGTFDDLGATCTVAVSYPTGRWFFHHSGPSSFAPSGEEVTVACPATFTGSPP